MELLKNIANKIKWLRTNKGLSQAELANLVGYTDRAAISRIEAGLTDIPFTKLFKIADALGVGAGYMFDYKSEETDMFENYHMYKEFYDKFEVISELNKAGQKKVLDYANDLVDNPNYKKGAEEPMQEPIAL